MSVRDPRSSRDFPRHERAESVREPTQSLQIDPAELGDAHFTDDGDDDADYGDDLSNPSHPSLARGTHEARDSHTKIESPAAQRRTPLPPEPVSAAPRKPSGRAKPPAHRADDPADYLGTVLGTYRVDELLGKGGMGYVFRAEHVKLGREVALKLLRADYAKRRDAVARFFQEARTVNRVRHRNIVDVTDFVELDDGTTFIIMELLSGVSLGKWARSGVDLPRALAVLVQICDGLGAAHAVGVIHRDLKPDNVIVVPTPDGAELVKLLDFGVAKLLNRDDEDVGFQTAAGSVIGTPAYMSPEQAGGMAIDHRSDIYSLGAIMYELFCGQPMFRGRSFGEYVRKHLTEMPVLPRATEGGKDVDPRLEALIMKCLDKEPAQRFGHILELRDGLLHMLGGIDTYPHGMGLQSGVYSGVRATPPPGAMHGSQPSYPGMAPGLPGMPPPMPHVQGLPLVAPHTPQPTPMPTPLALQMPQLMPSQPQMMPVQAQMLPSSPAMQTHISSMQSSSQHPSQLSQVYASQIAAAPQPSTPWYVWMFGGVIAVGLGIGGAWYVSRDTGLPAAKHTQPAVQALPATDPAPAAAPSLVELRFDSLPSAGVYADGHSAELCRTPCAFDVDLKDGGAVDKRVFVVRSEGYQDKQVTVDLVAPQRDIHVTLEQIEKPIAPVTPDQTAVTPTTPIKKPITAPRPGGGTAHPNPIHKPVVDDAAKPVEPKPDPKPVTPDPKPEPKPVTPKIPDATDTLDPFHKKP